jgi:glycine/serine hydroxymethyltransferase
MGEPEMDRIAGFVDRLLGGEDPADVRAAVAELAGSFPLP